MPEKKTESSGGGLGSAGLLLGGGAVVALAALDGGILTIVGCGALAYGVGYTVTKLLTPDDADTDRGRRDIGILKYGVAGACALATFLNPFIGIPGSVLIVLTWMSWRQDIKEFFEETKKASAPSVEEEEAESTMDACLV